MPRHLTPPPTLTADLLTTAEVAALLGVDRHTVPGWCRRYGIRVVRTPTGRLRYPAGPVRAAAATYRPRRTTKESS